MEIKFYRCPICGQIAIKVLDKSIPLVCCGKPMEELKPNTTDAANEKHVPVIVRDGNKVVVKVGEVAHPMTDAHYIQWILLVTSKGNQRKELTPSSLPEATFYIGEDEEVLGAYEYCNLHGFGSYFATKKLIKNIKKIIENILMKKIMILGF